MKVFPAICICAMMSLTACDLGNSNGYVPTEAEIAQIQVGADNKSKIEERFGPPTVIGETDDIWYYAATQRRYVGSLPTIESERRILEIRFQNDQVVSVDEFGQERGENIAISRYVTQTGGRVLTLWEQLYGSLGNFSAENFLDRAGVTSSQNP